MDTESRDENSLGEGEFTPGSSTIVREDADAVRRIQNRVVNSPIPPSEPSSGNIFLLQPPFSLSEADYMKLKNADSPAASFGFSLLILSFGGGLQPIINYVNRYSTTKNLVSPEIQIYIWLFILLIGVIFILFGRQVRNDRKQILKKIEVHFRDNPSVLHTTNPGRH